MIIPPWVKPAIAAVALVGAFSAGWTVNGWRWEAKQADALREQQEAFNRQLAKQDDIATEYEQSRERGRVQARDRETQVRTIYETVEVPGECAAPDSVRGVLSEAVASANTAAGQPDG